MAINRNYYFLHLYVYFYFWLCCVFVAAQVFSLVAVSSDYSGGAVLGLLIAVASLVVEHGLWGMGTQ